MEDEELQHRVIKARQAGGKRLTGNYAIVAEHPERMTTWTLMLICDEEDL